jgi:hypothetical protein
MSKQYDGQNISAFKGRFALSFDMDTSDGEDIEHGDAVTFLVRARVTKGAVGEDKKTGELIRTNTFSTTDVQIMDEDDINAAAIEAFMENTAMDFADLLGEAPDEGSTVTTEVDEDLPVLSFDYN